MTDIREWSPEGRVEHTRFTLVDFLLPTSAAVVQAEVEYLRAALLDILDCMARGDGVRDDEVFVRYLPLYDELRLRAQP